MYAGDMLETNADRADSFSNAGSGLCQVRRDPWTPSRGVSLRVVVMSGVERDCGVEE